MEAFCQGNIVTTVDGTVVSLNENYVENSAILLEKLSGIVELAATQTVEKWIQNLARDCESINNGRELAVRLYIYGQIFAFTDIGLPSDHIRTLCRVLLHQNPFQNLALSSLVQLTRRLEQQQSVETDLIYEILYTLLVYKCSIDSPVSREGLACICRILKVNSEHELLASNVHEILARFAKHRGSTEAWTQSAAKNALAWCVEHFDPSALRSTESSLDLLLQLICPLIDGIDTSNQIIGLRMLCRIVQVCTPTRLQWHQSTLFLLLENLLYTRENLVLHSVFECIFNLIVVMPRGDRYDLYDKFTRRMLTDMVLTSEKKLRLVYMKFARLAFQQIGIQGIRFTQVFLSVLDAYTNTLDIELLDEIIHCVDNVLQFAFPVVETYSEHITTIVLRIVSRMQMKANPLADETRILQRCQATMLHLKTMCDKETFSNVLKRDEFSAPIKQFCEFLKAN